MRAVAAAVAALLLAGCSSSHSAAPRRPTLPRAVAQSLRAQSDGVAAALAAGDGCLAQERAVALQTAVISDVNARRLPPRFQETLVASVNDLVSRITCVPPPAPHGREHEKHGGHGKHGKEGD